MVVKESWNVIEEVLREKEPSVFRCLRHGAPISVIERFEAKIGLELPRTFRDSLMIHDGLRQSYLGSIRLFDYWALLPLAAILEEWHSMVEIQDTLGLEGSALRCAREIKRGQHWRRGWIPFMDADGDKIVLDLDPATPGEKGQIFLFHHAGGTADLLLADSYEKWFSDLATTLPKRLRPVSSPAPPTQPNRVAGSVNSPGPHTTGHAGPHPAVPSSPFGGTERAARVAGPLQDRR